MITIGKPYRSHHDGETRLNAKISARENAQTLWFSLPSSMEDYFTRRADPFLALMLPYAMRTGQDVRCEGEVSERLLYQCERYLIPTFGGFTGIYKSIKIDAPASAAGGLSPSGVATGFSGGVDSLYTILRMTRKGVPRGQRLTHLCLFNIGVFDEVEGDLNAYFAKTVEAARRFAAPLDLEVIPVNSNFRTALPERFLDVYSFRNLAAALSLGGLLKTYALSSGRELARFSLDVRNIASADLLLIQTLRTETLEFFSGGGGVLRGEKLEALSDWPSAFDILHPCLRNPLWEPNCGDCYKDALTMVELYALGKLERFHKVFPTKDFEKKLDQKLGVLLFSKHSLLCADALRRFEERGFVISRRARAWAALFERQAAAKRDTGEGSLDET